MYLKSDVCKEHINFKIQGATRKVLKKDDLFTLQIPVPKVEKQRKLLEKINNIESEITILEKNIEEKKSDITDLINNIWFI
jgi:restriction endonuclease S subunit